MNLFYYHDSRNQGFYAQDKVVHAAIEINLNRDCRKVPYKTQILYTILCSNDDYFERYSYQNIVNSTINNQYNNQKSLFDRWPF